MISFLSSHWTWKVRFRVCWIVILSDVFDQWHTAKTVVLLWWSAALNTATATCVCVCVCVYLCTAAASGRAARALIIHVSGLKLHGTHGLVHSHTVLLLACNTTLRHQIHPCWARTAWVRPSVKEMMSDHVAHNADHKRLHPVCVSAQHWTKHTPSQQQPEQHQC